MGLSLEGLEDAGGQRRVEGGEGEGGRKWSGCEGADEELTAEWADFKSVHNERLGSSKPTLAPPHGPLLISALRSHFKSFIVIIIRP